MKKVYLFLVAILFITLVSANAATYTRVNAKPTAGWQGKYLIVYEVSATQAYVWNGTNESGNYVKASIEQGKIKADNLANYLVTVSNEGSNKYSVKAADGYISTEAKSNGITYSKGAVDCTISSNGDYIMLETNTNTCRFLYNTGNGGQFRFFYDKDKKWVDTGKKNICFYVEGDQEIQPSTQTLDINYAQAEMYACESKFPTTSNPNYQYFSTFLWLLQEEDEDAVPQVGLEILAPTQYSIARNSYSSDYSNTSSGYINISAGSKHSFFNFPSKAEAGYSTAAISKAEMSITKVGPSALPNAYVYHIKLEFTDSNKKIWKLDKDLDVYAWWIDCDRSGKELQDMEPVAFALESGNHNTQTGIWEVESQKSEGESQKSKVESQKSKVIKDGHIYLMINGECYSILGNKIK